MNAQLMLAEITGRSLVMGFLWVIGLGVILYLLKKILDKAPMDPEWKQIAQFILYAAGMVALILLVFWIFTGRSVIPW